MWWEWESAPGSGGGRALAHDHHRRTEQAVADFVTLAHLPHDVTLGHRGVFLLADGLVQVGVELFALGLNGLDAARRHEFLQLPLDHLHAEYDRRLRIALADLDHAKFEI